MTGKRAEIRTTHGSPVRAAHVAAAVSPDNTDEMTTRVEDDAVVTTVERDSTGGLQSTVDDYVVNLRVAAQLADQPTQSNHE
ncbi:KEOPS complex subunit Pcc1 [Haloarcula amylovorans]|uniref:KEOPS complex subunit Pcc1 n=1 Tax=Haloarcula amylovorans TaxID=2562280 RepID=UPI001075F684|nr:KEOPS complex subunit Pcc1 [Halomicroarcula amylolytica]